MTSVSILIPCFNAAAFLRSTLESAIQNMEYGDEIILVDDHSTDGSLQLARGFLQNENINFKALINPNKGACSARNHAFSHAQNPLIQWLDADDILGKDKMKEQRLLLAGSPIPSSQVPSTLSLATPSTAPFPKDETGRAPKS